MTQTNSERPYKKGDKVIYDGVLLDSLIGKIGTFISYDEDFNDNTLVQVSFPQGSLSEYNISIKCLSPVNTNE